MDWQRGTRAEPQVYDLKKAYEKLRGRLGLKGKRGLSWLQVGLGLLIALAAFTSFYTVDAEERAVILRLGEYHRTTSPGLHFKWPLGLETVYVVKTERVMKEEFGYRTLRAAERSQYQKQGYEEESSMLTGDLNVIDVEWIVQYRISEPNHWLFRVADGRGIIRDISESVVRRVVGNRTFDDVLTNRMEIVASVMKELQEILDSYETGVDIVTVKLQDVNPPQAVKAAFNEVNEAIQERERLINQAQEAYNEAVPKARGQAEQEIARAQGYAIERVNAATGDAARFSSLYEQYRKARDVTRRRMYLEAMSEVLPKVKDVYVIDPGVRTLLPHLDVGRKGGEKP